MFAQARQSVILGSRNPNRAAAIVQELGQELDQELGQELDQATLSSRSYADAADADIVLPAMLLRDGMLETLEPFRHQLDGKVYVDISNPFNDTYTDFILPWDTSGAEQIQHRFPKTRVVRAFKNVWWEVFDEPTFGDTVSNVFVISDDESAKSLLLGTVANNPFRYIDAGHLANARTIERITLLSGELGQRYGFFPPDVLEEIGQDVIPHFQTTKSIQLAASRNGP